MFETRLATPRSANGRQAVAHYRAVTDIEDAVVIAESHGYADPIRLRSLYEDALLITDRTRYRDTLHDILKESRTIANPSSTERFAVLTDRQLQIARLAASGFTNPGIARRLHRAGDRLAFAAHRRTLVSVRLGAPLGRR